MSSTIAKVFHRASQCPVALFLKLLLSVSFVYALHVAAYHQVDMSPYSFIWLVDLVAVIAILALTFNWRCQYRNVEKNEDGSSTNEQ